jgi:predicted  nucleic acid-binding Zn-ribbon protein
MKDKCANCGGWFGFHQATTNRCPLGGVDQTMRKNPMYTSNTYVEEPKDVETLQEENEALLERIEILESTVRVLKSNVLVNFDKYEEVFQRIKGIETQLDRVEHTLEVHTNSRYNPHAY